MKARDEERGGEIDALREREQVSVEVRARLESQLKQRDAEVATLTHQAAQLRQALEMAQRAAMQSKDAASLATQRLAMQHQQVLQLQAQRSATAVAAAAGGSSSMASNDNNSTSNRRTRTATEWSRPHRALHESASMGTQAHKTPPPRATRGRSQAAGGTTGKGNGGGSTRQRGDRSGAGGGGGGGSKRKLRGKKGSMRRKGSSSSGRVAGGDGSNGTGAMPEPKQSFTATPLAGAGAAGGSASAELRRQVSATAASVLRHVNALEEQHRAGTAGSQSGQQQQQQQQRPVVSPLVSAHNAVRVGCALTDHASFVAFVPSTQQAPA